VPDFVELEQHRDPKIDECIVQACGADAQAGRLVSSIDSLIAANSGVYARIQRVG